MTSLPNKFHARKCVVDGITFGSKTESRRYQDLKNLERAHEISDLKPHPKFDLTINGDKVGVYTADASYLTKTGELVIEDTKSKATMTEAASLRIKVFQAIYGLRVLITGTAPARRVA